MKIVVVGYGEMLNALVEGISASEHEIVGVFRHENVKLSPFKKFFIDRFSPSKDYNLVRYRNLTDIKAKSVNSSEFRKFLNVNKVDIVFVGSWSEKFSPQTINTPKYGVVNIHPSLLPKYRGPNPYLQVILHGEKETGITFHLMDVNYDTGAILHQKVIPTQISDNGKTLKHRCCNAVKSEIKYLLSDFESRMKYAVSQNENYATYQARIGLKETILNFKDETADETDRRIRALTPWAECFIPYKHEYFSFKNHKILSVPVKQAPATIIGKDGNSLSVVCKDHKVIRFSELKINRMFSKPLTKFFLNNIVKVNEKAF